ncbi:unnamed protein product, partial [Didymodactylos carnosus]
HMNVYLELENLNRNIEQQSKYYEELEAPYLSCNDHIKPLCLLHGHVEQKRKEKNDLNEKLEVAKYNYHRNIAKITQQCANLAMAFRSNYYSYMSANLDEIKTKTESRLNALLDEVNQAKDLAQSNDHNLTVLNEKFDRDMVHFDCLKKSIEIITNKLKSNSSYLNDEKCIKSDLVELQLSIEELEKWHARTGYPDDAASLVSMHL